ncbi:MAG TPA: hypothetical protein VJ785_17565 [Anaerolineales bacterium]|nr:hypothetical protein [Anaerolineales bacterium]
MKKFKILLIFSVIAMLVGACGAEPVPTMSAADVQSTAVAAAFTLVAQTQAAMPTATPLPPTNTPTATSLPTDTPASLPTVAGSATVAAVSGGASGAATVDPCSTRVLSDPQGRDTIIRIVNTTNVAATVSIYLNETASHGACGYRGYTLSKNNDVVITDLVQGCYNLWAWSDDPRGKFNSSGYGCINNSDKWTFEISSGSIKFVGP